MNPARPGQPRTAEHGVPVRAAAEPVFRLLADLDAWPRVFPPFVHLERLGQDERGRERVGMWAMSGERIDHWVALRTVDEAGLRVSFVPESAPPPLGSMHRSWVVEPEGAEACTVRLLHEYTVREDADAGALAAVERTVAEIAAAELSAVQAAAELVAAFPKLLLEVEDSVTIAAPARAVYAFLLDAGRWPERLDHVASADVREDGPDTHVLELVTNEQRGGTFTTKTARVGIAPHKIAYKQLLLPPLGSSHHVQWLIEETAHGTTVTSRQTVVIKESGVAAVLGEGTDLAQARAFVRRELSSKVLLVLEQARDHLESVERTS
ncbi:SRPBCC family protein [Streptomyces sp. TRM 70351]|uniref:aromatase/cyclase n=1 Tax=Streptomyces sp. TRM 70351 TaxID=3116552 RepID=UPI002E7B475A|nr:SRPBCC family protein [Streptomyces sp. TRM 70351]MEE1929394.1 SRPBCC family protein [Streptomyces sp. TRM 70351]